MNSEIVDRYPLRFTQQILQEIGEWGTVDLSARNKSGKLEDGRRVPIKSRRDPYSDIHALPVRRQDVYPDLEISRGRASRSIAGHVMLLQDLQHFCLLGQISRRQLIEFRVQLDEIANDLGLRAVPLFGAVFAGVHQGRAPNSWQILGGHQVPGALLTKSVKVRQDPTKRRRRHGIERRQ